MLDKTIIEKASHVGELLIRAAAVIGTLSPEEQAQLREATGGNLPDSVVSALRSAQKISPSVQQSMKSHPPTGLVDVVF